MKQLITILLSTVIFLSTHAQRGTFSQKTTLPSSQTPVAVKLSNGYEKRTLRLPFATRPADYIVKKVGHYYILNGDVIVDNDLSKSTRSYSLGDENKPGNAYINEVFAGGHKWPNAEIPVVIDKSIFDHNMQYMVVSALNEMNTQLELRLFDRTTEEDYVRIEFSSEIKGSGESPVGRQGGEQPLFLAAMAKKQTVIHELLHAAGIWHEQSRSDRDNFIRIREENLTDGTEYNFQIEPGDVHGSYDYCSIMHYWSKAFSKNEKTTIECTNHGNPGACPACMDESEKGLSPQDISGLDQFYNEVSRFASHYKFVLPQTQWRYCKKCHAMFYDGYPEKGDCPVKGPHEAVGYNFILPHDVAGTNTAQSSWRYCSKCFMLFYDGYPTKGVCTRGGGHTAAGFNFVLPHDVAGTATAQSSWRYCSKCFVMFYDGYPQKGLCPADHGGHVAAGYNFVLPHDKE